MAYGTYLNARDPWWVRWFDRCVVRWQDACEQARLRDLGRRMHVGREVYLRVGLVVYHPEHVMIADEVAINNNVTILAHDKVTIGRYAMIAPRVIITTVNHDERFRGRDAWGAHRTAPVHIGASAWIGAGAVILPGVTIGVGAVVGAGSVVTKDVEPDTVVAGVPAKFLKRRTNESIPARL